MAILPLLRLRKRTTTYLMKALVHYELDIDTPIELTALRVRIGGVRMGGAVTGWGNDTSHGNVPGVAKIIRHRLQPDPR